MIVQLQHRRTRISAGRTSAGAGFPDAPADAACPLGFRPPLSSGTSQRPEGCEVVVTVRWLAVLRARTFVRGRRRRRRTTEVVAPVVPGIKRWRRRGRAHVGTPHPIGPRQHTTPGWAIPGSWRHRAGTRSPRAKRAGCSTPTSTRLGAAVRRALARTSGPHPAGFRRAKPETALSTGCTHLVLSSRRRSGNGPSRSRRGRHRSWR
jgi:hypothetical protein